MIKTQTAIARILAENSELNEVWKDSDDYGAWLASVSDLLARVGALKMEIELMCHSEVKT